MAYENTTHHEQEMVERETEQPHYLSPTQRRVEDEATYSDIQLNNTIQTTTDHAQKKYFCISRLQLISIIVGIVLLAVSSSIITAIILQRKIDRLSDEIELIKLNISEDLLSNKPVMDQDNIWSTWSPWGDCSVSCNGGLKTRTRTCEGTDQGVHQESCSGNNVDIGGCNNNACRVPMVYFTMTRANSDLVSGNVTFSYTVVNVGGGYDNQTGEFVCPVAGLYHFFFSFLQQSTTGVSCNIKHNGIRLTYAHTDSDGTWDAASTSVYIQLAMGDVVTVGDCYNWQNADHGSDSGVFTGSLIHL